MHTHIDEKKNQHKHRMKKKKKKRTIRELDIHKSKKVLCNNAGNNKKGALLLLFPFLLLLCRKGGRRWKGNKYTHTHTAHGPAACLKRTTRSVIVSRPAAANRNARVSFFTLCQVSTQQIPVSQPFRLSTFTAAAAPVLIVLVLYVYSLHWFKCSLSLSLKRLSYRK